MPYTTTEELPKGVQKNLPAHARKIYKEAFNNAYDEYKNPDARRRNAGREEVARRVAWSAVKKKYEKLGDTWVKKD